MEVETSVTRQPPKNRAGFAIAGLVMGCAMLLGWCLPCIGIPLGIAGVVLSALGLRSTKRGFAIAGLVLCILGLLLAVANAAIGAWMALNGEHGVVNFLNP